MLRIRPRSDVITDLTDRATKLFARSPLSNFLPLIQRAVQDVAGTSDPSGASGLVTLTRLIEFYERIFANGFGPRFDLDAWLASDICTHWNAHGMELPRLIVPIYGDAWAYSLLPSPWNGTGTVAVYAISFPGRSQYDDLNLLEYAWLWHEIGHHALAKAGTSFARNFKARVDATANMVLRKSAADSANLRAGAESYVKNLRQLWTPSPNTRDWANEIAADAIALWTCGPAFLLAVHSALDNRRINPFEISYTHPPYELRLRLLLDLAENLEWAGECGDLNRLIQQWKTDTTLADANNYAALTDRCLAEECSAEIIKACRAWGLPLCTPEFVREATHGCLTKQGCGSALELILTAHRVFKENPNGLENWEQTIIAQLRTDLNGDS